MSGKWPEVNIAVSPIGVKANHSGKLTNSGRSGRWWVGGRSLRKGARAGSHRRHACGFSGPLLKKAFCRTLMRGRFGNRRGRRFSFGEFRQIDDMAGFHLNELGVERLQQFKLFPTQEAEEGLLIHDGEALPRPSPH